MSGLRGTSMAQVHSNFSSCLIELREDAVNQVEALQNITQRRWQVPRVLLSDLLDIKQLHEPAFNRDDINSEYEKAVNDPDKPGTNGDVISLKLQMDYMAAAERAFRVRHSTPCRSICHAMGRRYGQGKGWLFDAIRNQAEKAIATGGAS